MPSEACITHSSFPSHLLPASILSWYLAPAGKILRFWSLNDLDQEFSKNSRFPSHLHSTSIILTPIAKNLEFWSLQEPTRLKLHRFLQYSESAIHLKTNKHNKPYNNQSSNFVLIEEIH